MSVSVSVSALAVGGVVLGLVESNPVQSSPDVVCVHGELSWGIVSFREGGENHKARYSFCPAG